MLRNTAKRFFTPQVYEVILYTAGCGCSLILKVIIATVINCIGLSFWTAYLITHIFLLFCSFFYHHCITFRKKFDSFSSTAKDFLDFTAAVAVLKILDYFLVNIGVESINRYLIPEDASMAVKQIVNAGTIICISGCVFVLRYFIYRILFKKAPVEYYTGNNVKQVYLAFASDSTISGNAASGGTVTALLLSMLKNRKIDGALVTVSDFSLPEEQRYHTIIATTEDDLRRSQGSVYCDFRYITEETLEQLRSFSGRIAAVGLPCQLKQLDGICSQYPDLAEKMVLKIGLFCGHTSKPELLKEVLKKKNIAEDDVSSFRFRHGKWRGNAKAVLKNGEIRQWPTAFYNLYQNLFVAAPARCMCCFDHFAEQADISTGDVWCQKYRFAEVKPSMTAIRSERGAEYFSEAVRSGEITVQEKQLKDLYKANSRSVVFHKAAAAKARVLKKYGIHIPVSSEAHPARWNEVLAVKIIAAFYTRETAEILKINRRILKFCLYVMKGLTSF